MTFEDCCLEEQIDFWQALPGGVVSVQRGGGLRARPGTFRPYDVDHLSRKVDVRLPARENSNSHGEASPPNHHDDLSNGRICIGPPVTREHLH